ncbi:MAG: nucleotide exchange factor GrpE [Lachnospiraceae bacterium]|nr:nucleotide exchange factor GrpE [Lachnospiraceae bacterium]
MANKHEENLDELLKKVIDSESDSKEEEKTASEEEAKEAEVVSEEAEETAESEEAEASDEEKKDKKDEMIDDLKDKLMRQMAEFENFRKRSEKEKSQMYDMGVKSFIEKILPVVDNFERGLAQVPEENKNDSFVDGMNLVYKQILTAFDEIGVAAIETEGKEFDPNLHNAVMHVEDDSVGDNMIVEEFQKGYTYHDSVVRHSMVKVAN